MHVAVLRLRSATQRVVTWSRRWRGDGVRETAPPRRVAAMASRARPRRRRRMTRRRARAITRPTQATTGPSPTPTASPAPLVLVASITQTNPALITVVDEQRHGLEVGDIVSLTSCVGCDSLNDRELKVLRGLLALQL